jgi:octaprenyl-diphosphate synthase
MCGYSGDKKLLALVGVVLEYIHTASLLHDDVIDNTSVRRGQASANAIYGNAVSVLSGDYLYASAFANIIDMPGKELGMALTKATVSMSEGEICQLLKTGDMTLSMEEYLHIIYCKTGALFSAACRCGAILGKGDADLLTEYGKAVGYAFQMQDDYLDYFGREEETGKRPGTDLGEKKMTLPMILLSAELPAEEKTAVEKLFLSDEALPEKLQNLLSYFDKYNIREKCKMMVQGHIDKALEILSNYEDSPYKQALVALTKELNSRDS